MSAQDQARHVGWAVDPQGNLYNADPFGGKNCSLTHVDESAYEPLVINVIKNDAAEGEADLAPVRVTADGEARRESRLR